MPVKALRDIQSVLILQPLSILPCGIQKRFGLLPVRSPLLREYNLSLFHWVLGCFTSPGALHRQRYRRQSCRVATRGFPIRTSSDHRLLRTSPKLFAATQRPSSPFGAKASTIHPYCAHSVHPRMQSIPRERKRPRCTRARMHPDENAISNFYLKKLIRSMRLSKFVRSNKKPPGGRRRTTRSFRFSDVDSRLDMFASFPFA